MSKLTFTENAQADLSQTWLYVADENLAAADGVDKATSFL